MQVDRSRLTRFAWLSIAAAIVTIGLKTGAYYLTGSVGLLSDALESLVNLVAAIMALAMLVVSAQPPDDTHHFGHGKAEYFSSGLEGLLILIAAGGIGYTAYGRLMEPQPLAALDMGLAVSALAAAVNFWVAQILLKGGRRYRSITLEADGKHLLTDVWTSLGVLAGLGAVMATGWLILDPIIAMLVGLNIVWTGVSLIRRSISGLLDETLPVEENLLIDEILNDFRADGIGFHDLRTRQAGAQRFMTLHVLVPGSMTVKEGHDLVERIESRIEAAVGGISLVTHLEPQEEPESFIHNHEPENSSEGRVLLAPTPPTQKKSIEIKGLRRQLWRRRLGGLLVFAGTALSFWQTGISADISMVSALIGFIVIAAEKSTVRSLNRRS